MASKTSQEVKFFCEVCYRELDPSSPLRLCKACCLQYIENLEQSLQSILAESKRVASWIKALKEKYAQIKETPSLRMSKVLELCRSGFVGIKSDWKFLRKGLGHSRHVWIFKPYKAYEVYLIGGLYVCKGTQFVNDNPSVIESIVRATYAELVALSVQPIVVDFTAPRSSLEIFAKHTSSTWPSLKIAEIDLNEKILLVAKLFNFKGLKDIVKIVGKEVKKHGVKVFETLQREALQRAGK